MGEPQVWILCSNERQPVREAVGLFYAQPRLHGAALLGVGFVRYRFCADIALAPKI